MAKLSYQTTERTALGPSLPAAIAELVDKEGYCTKFLRGREVRAEYSYEEMYGEMMRRAQGFLRMGLKKGDRVAFVLPETDDFVLSFLGALAAGVVPVPMYPPLSFGKLDAYIETASKIIESSGARMLLTDKRTQAVLWSLVDKVEALDELRTVDELEQRLDDDVEMIDLDHIQHDDLAFLQYTSGSTADPKGVVVTHGSLLANLDGIMNVGLQIREDDIAVSWLPLYHDMGLIGFVLAPMWFGVPTVYIATLDFVKQPSLWLETLSKYRGSLAFAPNFAYSLAVKRTRESKLGQLDLSCVRGLGCGAEPNHPETLRNFLEYFGRAGMKDTVLIPAYGMAEATLAMTFHDLDSPLRSDVIDADRYEAEGVAHPIDLDDDFTGRVSEHISCGKAFPGHEVLIVDENYQPLPERHVGEIVFRGPSTAAGYWGDDEKTARTFRDDGLLTGDLGYIADGELYVTGRQKDIIILNGRNYDPHAIEWVVQEVNGVRKGNVVAFSIPGERTEELVIVAERKEETVASEVRDAILHAVRDELFLSPADVVLVGRGQLPKTSSGKLQRRKTREQYMDATLGTEGVRTLGAQSDRITLAKHLARSAMSQVRHRVWRRAASVISLINPMSR